MAENFSFFHTVSLQVHSVEIVVLVIGLILFLLQFTINLINFSISSITGDGRKKQRQKQKDEKSLKTTTEELPTFPFQRARASPEKTKRAKDSRKKERQTTGDPSSGKSRTTTIPPERNVPSRTICPKHPQGPQQKMAPAQKNRANRGQGTQGDREEEKEKTTKPGRRHDLRRGGHRGDPRMDLKGKRPEKGRPRPRRWARGRSQRLSH